MRIYNSNWILLPHTCVLPEKDDASNPRSFSVVVRTRGSLLIGWCTQEKMLGSIFHNLEDECLLIVHVSSREVESAEVVMELRFNIDAIHVNIGDVITSSICEYGKEMALSINGTDLCRKYLNASAEPLKYPIVLVPEHGACEVFTTPEHAANNGTSQKNWMHSNYPCTSCSLESGLFDTPSFHNSAFDMNRDTSLIFAEGWNAPNDGSAPFWSESLFKYYMPIKLAEYNGKKALDITDYDDVILEFRVVSRSPPKSYAFGVHDGRMRTIMLESSPDTQRLKFKFVYNVSSILDGSETSDPYTPLKTLLAECSHHPLRSGDVISFRVSRSGRRLAVLRDYEILGGFAFTGNFKDFRFPIFGDGLMVEIIDLSIGFPCSPGGALESVI